MNITGTPIRTRSPAIQTRSDASERSRPVPKSPSPSVMSDPQTRPSVVKSATSQPSSSSTTSGGFLSPPPPAHFRASSPSCPMHRVASLNAAEANRRRAAQQAVGTDRLTVPGSASVGRAASFGSADRRTSQATPLSASRRRLLLVPDPSSPSPSPQRLFRNVPSSSSVMAPMYRRTVSGSGVMGTGGQAATGTPDISSVRRARSFNASRRRTTCGTV